MRPSFLILAVASVLNFTAAYAANSRWIRIEGNDHMVSYFDNYDNKALKPANKMSNGHIAMRVLFDYPLPAGKEHEPSEGDDFVINGEGTSEIQQLEYDCHKGLVRTTSVTEFGENMASSAPVQGDNDGFLWEPVERGNQFYKLACQSPR